jgi:D-3-phosphoglycerate dehydrogenase
MTTVFVTHPTQRLDQYFGPRATRELQAIADVRFNPHARELDTAELVAAAQDCDAVIAYRQTPAPRALFAGLPRLVAFVRCAVDIRTVDVGAASEHGVLVTQASPATSRPSPSGSSARWSTWAAAPAATPPPTGPASRRRR